MNHFRVRLIQWCSYIFSKKIGSISSNFMPGKLPQRWFGAKKRETLYISKYFHALQLKKKFIKIGQIIKFYVEAFK